MEGFTQALDGEILPIKRGRGRPPTKMREASRIAARERASMNHSIALRTRKIVDAQTVSAIGTYHLLELIRDPKNPQIIWERRIVRDIKRQEKFLDEATYGEDFIIVEGTPPDWRAGDALLNRAYGKPKETLEIEGEVSFKLKALHIVAPASTQAIAAPVKIIDMPAPPTSLNAG